MESVPDGYRTSDAAARIALIAESFARLLGTPLVDAAGDMVASLWQHPRAIVAHGIEADPLFFFGNRAALCAFGARLDQFIGMPSRLSAEAPLREERQALLERVSAAGFIDDYAGVRVRLDGTRFRIENAIVWNLIDADGKHHGQAAVFAI